MQVDNLIENHPKLLLQMEKSGCSKEHIARFKTEIRWILSESETRDWECYADVLRYCETVSNSHNTLKRKREIIGAIERFDLYGKCPCPKQKRPKQVSPAVKKSAYSKLIPTFKMLVDYYINEETKRGIKASTIKTCSNNASNFLFAMQEAGFGRLEEITEEAAMAIFVSQDGSRLKGHSYRRSVMALLKTCIPVDPDACQAVLSFLPKIKRTRKNIQYLTEQEAKKIRAALDDMSNALTKRDRAIGKLAMYTGLRRSDIAALDISSIDWENDIVKISQQKTGMPIELPLTALVGNAIYEYISDERPHSPNPAVFLALYSPYRRMSTDSTGLASARIMKAAGIRQAKGDRKGLHIFRHRVATTLLGNEVSQVIISRALGHYSPSSTEAYFSADFAHLRACSLGIGCFQISKEVFNV